MMHDDDDLERALRLVPAVKLDARFNDAVMQRIQSPSARGVVVQLFAEPVVPVTLASASVVAWQSMHGALTTGAALALAPLLGFLSWRLFRTYERITTPCAGGASS